MQRAPSVVRCGGEERSNVWLNLGASGVLCKWSVTGLSCSLGCPATVWAGCGANKRLFSGGTTVCVCVWRWEGGESKNWALRLSVEKWTVCAQAQSFRLQVPLEKANRDWNCVMNLRGDRRSLVLPSQLLPLCPFHWVKRI